MLHLSLVSPLSSSKSFGHVPTWLSICPSAPKLCPKPTFCRPIPLRNWSSSSEFFHDSPTFFNLKHDIIKARHRAALVVAASFGGSYGSGTSPGYTSVDPVELNKRAQVSKRLEQTARYFKRLGGLGFWGQLVCSVVSAVILAFSAVVTGNATAPVTRYLTAAGIAAAFISVFWSFGYLRLADRLQTAARDPVQAPPRTEVMNNLKNGVALNLAGMGATLLGMQATVGLLVGKALQSSAGPFLQGPAAGYSPVLALDVFLVQACANTFLSHFLGLVFSLELLRSVTGAPPPPDSVIPKPAT